MLKVIWTIFKRGIKHDNSKFSPVELHYNNIIREKIGKIKFGTKEHYDLLGFIAPGKNAHFLVNSHHIEYYKGNIKRMSPLDLIELLCDWKATTKCNNGNLDCSLKINKKKYEINNRLLNCLKRDIKEIGL